MTLLTIKNLSVAIQNTQILHDINISICPGEIYALMGPNGSGKSTLAHIIIGDDNCKILTGDIKFNGTSIIHQNIIDRAKIGIFMAFQHPVEIPGVSCFNFLKAIACGAHNISEEQLDIQTFIEQINQNLDLLQIDKTILSRGVNDGFSGGEKKKFEILQMLMLCPKIVILDEIDSGVDIDSIKDIIACIKQYKANNPSIAILVITHYNRLLEQLIPDQVCVLSDGRVLKSGGYELAQRIERVGYINI